MSTLSKLARWIPGTAVRYTLAGSAMSVFAVAPAYSQSPEPPPPPVVLANVTIIDGTGTPPVPGQTIVIQGEEIVAIGPSESIEVPDRAVIHQMPGRYVIPGLVDSHTHVTGSTRESTERQMGFALRGGITAIRDMAGMAPFLAGLALDLDRGEVEGPDLFYSAIVAGPDFMADPRAIRSSAGHGVGTAPWLLQVDGESNPAVVMATIRGTGATAVKIYADVEPDVFSAMTAAAHEAGLKVWAHGTVFPVKPMEQVIAGADALSHSPYLIWEGSPRIDDFTQRALGDFQNVAVDDPAIVGLLEEMARRGTFLDATLWVFERPSEDDVADLRRAWGADVTRLAHELGVPVIAGTDGLGTPGRDQAPNLHQELQYLVDAGVPVLEVLRMATLNAQQALGRGETHGSVAVGKVADLVILSADPSVDIAHTRDIVGVMKRGRLLFP